MSRPYITPYDQDRFGSEFLSDILSWVAENMVIGEIWTDDEIQEWLRDNAGEFGYVEEE